VPEARVESFDWSQVADPDFKRYRDQLLAIGCAKGTVRVIVETEINQVYNERRRAALAWSGAVLGYHRSGTRTC
jgi:hypothetical protein